MQRFGFKVFFIVLLAMGLAFWVIPEPGEDSEKRISSSYSVVASSEEVTTEVTLWLPDKYATHLEQVQREVKSGPLLRSRIEATLLALLHDEAFTLLPDETMVRELFVQEKEAIVSFDSAFRKKFNGGAFDEMLAVTALVNTVIFSFPEAIDKVTFLLDDRPAEVFAFHVDISGPQRVDHSFNE